jgi:chromosome partitioning protein
VKSVLIVNPKGGCGKTTIATNLAAAFANWGLSTALADTDRQHSSLDWLVGRPDTAAPIRGLDWSKDIKKPPKGIARLVIDSSASLRMNEVRELVRTADAVIIPVLPSVFDLRATTAFLKNFTDLKPIVDIGWLTDRSLYNEVAWMGLGVFDLRTKPALAIQQDWIPIVRFIENEG